MTAYAWTLPAAAHPVTIRMEPAGIEWAAAEIAREFGGHARRTLLVTDELVALHYAPEFSSALTKTGFGVVQYVFPPGESHKRLRVAAGIIDVLAERKFDRADLIIGLGGGVATDIAGFAAAIYQRGVPWVAVPTSLLGMVDAAIGGKTGVDHPLGKNLIGTFHQPQAVLAPLAALHTLAAREWRSGSAEVVKAALLSGNELWNAVRAHGVNLASWPREAAYGAIAQAAEAKISVVAQDERETGLRRILNLGHTFGHALETVTGYAAFTHGEAVMLGMRAAVKMSAQGGMMSAQSEHEISNVLVAAEFPQAAISPGRLIDALGHDKKTLAGSLHWVLMDDIGKPRIRTDLSPALVQDTAEWLCDIAAAGEVRNKATCPLRILVLNGPNLNLLGEREAEIYGSESYSELEDFITAFARELDIDVLIRQTNREGELIDIVQRARHWADGVIINPGGYSHTSVTLRDAIAAISQPVIEVHLTDIAGREDFRRRSLTGDVCRQCIAGRGFTGYRDALNAMVAYLMDNTKQQIQ